jgi:hypothetical protein
MLRVAALLAVFLLAFMTAARAQKPYDDERTPAGWAWKQIRNDQIVDFHARCGVLDPATRNGWDDACRQIPSKFLVDVLTVPKWRDRIVRHRVRIRGAQVEGAIDLSNVEISSEVWIDASRIEGNTILAGSHWFRPLSLRGSTLAGEFLAQRMHTESDIVLSSHAVFKGSVDLGGAEIGGNLDLESSEFASPVNANSVRVAGLLAMHDHASFGGDLNIVGAKIADDLFMQTSSFAKAVLAGSLTVGRRLLMDHATFGGDVFLRFAKIGDLLDMQSSSFAGVMDVNTVSVTGVFRMDNSSFGNIVDANHLNAAGGLLMHAVRVAGAVNLVTAKIGSSLEMQNSTFLGAVNANTLSVAGNLVVTASSFLAFVSAEALNVEGAFIGDKARFDRELDLVGAKIGGVLDVRGASAALINLSGAVAQELLLGNLGWWCIGATPLVGAPASGSLTGVISAPTHWPLGDPVWRKARCTEAGPAISPMIILRNVHVDALQDSIDAWPPFIDLEGFRYERLGGVDSIGRNDMRKRSPDEWTDWIERDRSFSTQPYTQLANVLLIAGHRDTAEAIQFAGRERERREARVRGDLRSWAWLTFLSVVAGYGIGTYTFHVLWCVLGVTVIGAIVLWFSPNARALWFSPNAWPHGVLCLVAASLHRLLPIVSLSKELEEFFNNPPANPRNLEPWQVAYFAVHAIIGWGLGLILLAAMSGLTQKG